MYSAKLFTLPHIQGCLPETGIEILNLNFTKLLFGISSTQSLNHTFALLFCFLKLEFRFKYVEMSISQNYFWHLIKVKSRLYICASAPENSQSERLSNCTQLSAVDQFCHQKHHSFSCNISKWGEWGCISAPFAVCCHNLTFS